MKTSSRLPLPFIALLALFIWTNGCSPKVSVPKKRYYQYDHNSLVRIAGDSLEFQLRNPLKCPLRFFRLSSNEAVHQALAKSLPLTLPPLGARRIAIRLPEAVDPDAVLSSIRFKTFFGDPNQFKGTPRVNLPFPAGKTYRIIQAHNGSFSHNRDFSRYALDFDLAMGDTVCAARDGIVIGVIKDYVSGGPYEELRDYANFISLYHEEGIITQYIHLDQDGSFVELGDTVKAGEPIGLAGLTGFTSVPHLHFNVLRPTEEGVISVPVDFAGGYEGRVLRKGSVVSRVESHPKRK